MTVVTKVWDREAINELLMTNARAVERALVVLHDRQTSTEQASLQTKDANGVGFGAFDAEIFSSFAEKVKRGYRLSERQLAVCRKANKHGIARLARYWKQLADEIGKKGGTVSASEAPASAPKPGPVTQVGIDQAIRERFAEKARQAAIEAEQERQAFMAKEAVRRSTMPAVANTWGDW